MTLGYWSKAAISAVVPSLLCGCVGIGMSYTQTAASDDVVLAGQRGMLIYRVKDPAFRPIEKCAVLRGWGPPDEVSRESATETLRYNHDLRWNGVVVWLILPIPLMVPVGRNYVDLTFEADRLVRVATKGENGSGFLCPVLKNPHTLEIGCAVEREQPSFVIAKQFIAPSFDAQPLSRSCER